MLSCQGDYIYNLGTHLLGIILLIKIELITNMKIKNNYSEGQAYISPEAEVISLNMEGILCSSDRSVGVTNEGFSEYGGNEFNWN